MDDFIITHRDLKLDGFCSKGQRRFAKQHGIDWVKFLEDGITARELIATGDARLLKSVERAIGRRRK